MPSLARGEGRTYLTCTAMAGAAKLRSTDNSSSLDSKNRHHSNQARLASPEVEVIKLNSAKIYRFLQLLSHSRGFFARV
jgi:hypothetical protein